MNDLNRSNKYQWTHVWRWLQLERSKTNTNIKIFQLALNDLNRSNNYHQWTRVRRWLQLEDLVDQVLWLLYNNTTVAFSSNWARKKNKKRITWGDESTFQWSMWCDCFFFHYLFYNFRVIKLLIIYCYCFWNILFSTKTSIYDHISFLNKNYYLIIQKPMKFW